MNTEITLKGSSAGGGAQYTPVPAQRPTDVATLQRPPVQQVRANSAEQLEAAVNELASALQSVQRNLNFSIDEESGRTVVKVIDSSSDEIIRQFPSEEALALARRMREMNNSDLTGLLLRSKA